MVAGVDAQLLGDGDGDLDQLGDLVFGEQADLEVKVVAAVGGGGGGVLQDQDEQREEDCLDRRDRPDEIEV